MLLPACHCPAGTPQGSTKGEREGLLISPGASVLPGQPGRARHPTMATRAGAPGPARASRTPHTLETLPTAPHRHLEMKKGGGRQPGVSLQGLLCARGQINHGITDMRTKRNKQ